MRYPNKHLDPPHRKLNPMKALLDRVVIVPAVNQIEVHPYFTQKATRDFNAAHGIVTQAWSPIGGITVYRGDAQRSTLTDPVIRRIAEAHGKSAAQVMLRWHLQQLRSAIPKSVRPERTAENFEVFDFELAASELAAIDALDTGVRRWPDPDSITLERPGMPVPEA